jgi:hypothetical protein
LKRPAAVAAAGAEAAAPLTAQRPSMRTTQES